MPDQAHRETDKELEKMERKLRTIYGQAAVKAQKKADRYFDKFAELDHVKRKQVDEGKLSEKKYLTWRKNKMAMGENYRAMVDTLTSDMVNTNQIAASIVNGHLPDVYANNYNFGTYQIEHDSEMDTSFTLYDRQTVERLLRDNPDSIPIKPRIDIPKDQLWNKRKINDVITTSILTGDSVPDIAKSLQEVVAMNQVAALRTARTAVTSAENGGRVDSYRRAQEMGIKMQQQWLATLDGRTRDSHRALDGEIIAVAKDKWHPAKFSNGCRFPGDPQGPGHEIYNCRCTLLGVVDGVDFDLSDVTQRDSKLGEQSYDEWKAGHKKKAPVKPVTPAKSEKQSKSQKKFKDFKNNFEEIVDFEIGEFTQWKQDLNNEELHAVQDYANDSTVLNDFLRNGTLRIGTDQKTFEEWVDKLDSAINKHSLTEPLTVYRGVGVDYLGLDLSSEDFVKNLVGKTITEKSFMSTSLAQEVGEVYGRGAVIKINVPRGTKAMSPDIARSSAEELKEYLADGDAGNMEITFGRQKQLHFTGYSYKYDSEGKRYVELLAELI